MKKKKSLAVMICMVLLLGVTSLSGMFASGAAAYQGASSWAVPELDKAAGYGFITDRIKDNMAGDITREEFAEIAVALYEKHTGKKAEAGNVSFTDTRNTGVLKAANLGLVTGAGGKFDPSAFLTREQMATILFRALKVINPSADFSTTGAGTFSDDKSISSWAKEGVYYCFKAGILKGINNRFAPREKSTREAAVITVVRAYELYNQGNGNGSGSGSAGADSSTGKNSNAGGAVQTPPASGSVSFSTTELRKGVEALESYSRKIHIARTDLMTSAKSQYSEEYAYVKAPLSTYSKLEYPAWESYREEVIIGKKAWDRLAASDPWTAWDGYMSDTPVSFKYNDVISAYPILYEKLAFTKDGTETVGGVNCVKYVLSGTYQDTVIYNPAKKDKYPIKLTASGTVWIADDAAVKKILVRQRLTIDTEATVKKDTRVAFRDIIEDDITKINSTVIQPPVQ
jgi:hypothetical protein